MKSGSSSHRPPLAAATNHSDVANPITNMTAARIKIASLQLLCAGLFCADDRTFVNVKQYKNKVIATYFYRTHKGELLHETIHQGYMIINGVRHDINHEDAFRFGSNTGMENNIEEKWVTGIVRPIAKIDKIEISYTRNGVVRKVVNVDVDIENAAQQADAPEPLTRPGDP